MIADFVISCYLVCQLVISFANLIYTNTNSILTITIQSVIINIDSEGSWNFSSVRRRKKNNNCDDFRAVSFSENGVLPAGDDLRWLRSYDSRQVRDASRWKELPRGMSFVCRVCNTAYAFMFHPWAKTLLSKRLRADLRCEVCTLHGEDQLLGFRIKGSGFGVSRGVFRVLHVRPTITSWHPVFSPSGTTHLSKGLWTRIVLKQPSRLVTIVVFHVSLFSLFFFSQYLLRASYTYPRYIHDRTTPRVKCL